MSPTDIVISIILVIVLGGAAAYVIRARKKGVKCVGCPYAKECGGKCSCPSQKNDN